MPIFLVEVLGHEWTMPPENHTPYEKPCYSFRPR